MMNITAIPIHLQSLFIRLGLSMVILAGLCFVPTHTVTAQSPCYTAITVTSNADSGAGTLRQAITDLCAGGTITFDRSLSGGTITLLSRLTINKNMTIDGSTLTDQITISGGNNDEVLSNDHTLTLKSLKITQGYSGRGGGIYNSGTLTVTNSSFSDNEAIEFGGAIFNSSGCTATVTNSTFSGNTADRGGVIYNAGTLAVRNSTFTGNSAVTSGSGIITMSSMTIDNSTIYGNAGSYALYNYGTMTISNTILAGTSGGLFDCYNAAVITSASKNNLIQNDNACAAIMSATMTAIDPMLNPLADNGGPTQTFALQAGSPAINAGDYATCLNAVDGKDQRSVTREDASIQCDIGAFEVGTYLLPEVSSSTPASGDVLVTSPSTLSVIFNKDVDSDSATNPVNYLLASPGTDGTFQTWDCLTGLIGDDKKIAVNSVTYDSDTFTATLNVNGGHALPNADYGLWVCGTTSIIDSASTKLNNGTDDTRVDFTVSAASTGGGTGGRSTDAISKLPATGFAPGRVTSLPARSTDYSGLNLTLEIPAIHVNAPVVGVPQNKSGWDVAWLGHDAGWLNGSAFPTWAGNSVITGHVWDADNQPGLFADLKSLKYGDTVLIHAFGEVYTYEVRDTRLVSPLGFNKAIDHEDKPWITLVTCEDFDSDSGNYIHRRLVSAVLLNVTSE